MSAAAGKGPAIGYHDGKSPGNNVITYFENHREYIPDRTAFRWSNGPPSGENPAYSDVDYGTFAGDIARVAAGLLETGLKTGDRVVVFLPIGVDLYTAMFAVLRIGAVAVFLDSWARRDQLAICAERVAPAGVISFDAALGLVASTPEFSTARIRVSADESEQANVILDDLRRVAKEEPVHPVESETTALVTFTTGSSGAPKGANRTHRFLSAQHLALADVIPYEESDIDLPTFPIFCLNNLASGVTTIIPAIDLANPQDGDGAVLARQMSDTGATCATLSPSLFEAVSRHCVNHDQRLTSLRRVVTGGAPVSKHSIQTFMQAAPDAEPLVLYGSTEVEPMAEITGREMLDAAAGEEEGVNVGTLHPALNARFISITKEPVSFDGWEDLEVPAGEVGELVVSGEHVCRDYYNDPEAFRKAKIVDEEGTVWHRTGDLGRLDENGHLWIVGRVHNAILRGGAYFFPVHAEVLLGQIPGVKKGAYVGVPDPDLNERATVAVTLEDRVDPGAVVAKVKDALAQQGVIVDSLHVLSSLPLDPRHHSKIEYDVLRETILREKPRDWV